MLPQKQKKKEKKQDEIEQGTKKVTHASQHDYASTDHSGRPVDVKKEVKHTTVIKPSVKKKESGPKASASQQRQMAQLCE
jgi:hypothetical protein